MWLATSIAQGSKNALRAAAVTSYLTMFAESDAHAVAMRQTHPLRLHRVSIPKISFGKHILDFLAAQSIPGENATSGWPQSRNLGCLFDMTCSRYLRRYLILVYCQHKYMQ